jgi:hypothetical protein
MGATVFLIDNLLDHNPIGTNGSPFPKRRRLIASEPIQNRAQLLYIQSLKFAEKNDLRTFSRGSCRTALGNPAPNCSPVIERLR